MSTEVLVVASRLKQYIREKSGMNTSDAVLTVLSDHLRRLAEDGIESARAAGRKTVMERDIPPVQSTGGGS
jgi:histone H3/H4